ncbi:hypothetical protein Asulf_00970 [Archaeoglobus sulfaticallidus PM70-1]|uniref:Uncharacterized protein n=1 Tax=Archaeoglobus sulfaticallidus PM70-1 TaxID=387631 RepID=N0BBK0_9EURY|nr:hypothetical protein [Archaeoglobus sulfaticallidus]AGK60974.1 hypothetical protein Asulf_00970 [Archaeoglobus sulfaticallidus PM70-1]
MSVESPIIEAIEKIEKLEIEPSEILTILTGPEKSVLYALLMSEKAINPNEIRTLLTRDVILFLLRYANYWNLRVKLKKMKFPDHLRPFIWKDIINLHSFHDGEVVKELKSLTKKPISKHINDYIKFLKKYDIAKIPDYRTIERILKEFEVSGIVISRIEVGKAKKVYALNPLLRKKISMIS